MKNFRLYSEQVLRILTDKLSTQQAWIEDPNFRKIYTPVNVVLELKEGWKYFNSVDPSVSLIQVHLKFASIVALIGEKGQLFEFTREENREFVDMIRLAIEHHNYRVHYWHGNDMSETVGFTVTKR
jgi:hypothetical protein